MPVLVRNKGRSQAGSREQMSSTSHHQLRLINCDTSLASMLQGWCAC